MNEREISDAIFAKVEVTHHNVTLAKQHFLRQEMPVQFNPEGEFALFAAGRGHEYREYNGNASDHTAQIELIANYLSDVLCASQAFWELVGTGVLLPISAPTARHASIGWKSSRGGGGFGELREKIRWVSPGHASKSPALLYGSIDPIVDGDLYLSDAGLTDASPEIQESARDSVDSLRAGLFRPAIVMLGKTSEGAWIELGTALTPVLQGSARNTLLSNINDHRRSTANKIAEIVKQYTANPSGRKVQKLSGVSDDDFSHIVAWTDVVRDARNAIHPRGTPTPPNTYEKTAVLFLRGADALRKLYSIRRAAIDLEQESSQASTTKSRS